jgi:protein gp37
MADKTAIGWTEATWNPVTGCSKVSPGCAHCYAEAISLRFGRSVGPWTPANAAENVVCHPDRLGQPLKWRSPRMIFVNSMSDLFHEQVPDEYICAVFDVMRACSPGVGVDPEHTFQVLTKRPERMRDICRRLRFDGKGDGRVWLAEHAEDRDGYALMGGLPGCKSLPNVWLGVSIENRRFVDRAEILRQTPAAVRFISAEPLLGPLRYDGWTEPPEADSGWPCWADDFERHHLDLTAIDWLIVGGESGAGYRPMREEWVRDLRDACDQRGTAFFMKQDCGAKPGRLGRFEGWPQEFPTAVRA